MYLEELHHCEHNQLMPIVWHLSFFSNLRVWVSQRYVERCCKRKMASTINETEFKRCVLQRLERPTGIIPCADNSESPRVKDAETTGAQREVAQGAVLVLKHDCM
jgi:hypothetical protein